MTHVQHRLQKKGTTVLMSFSLIDLARALEGHSKRGHKQRNRRSQESPEERTPLFFQIRGLLPVLEVLQGTGVFIKSQATVFGSWVRKLPDSNWEDYHIPSVHPAGEFLVT